MTMKIGITEGRRIVVDFSSLRKAITSNFEWWVEKRRQISRKAMSLADLIDNLIYKSFSLHGVTFGRQLWKMTRAGIYGLAYWFFFIFLNLTAVTVDYRMRVVSYSERVHVRLLLLAERAKVSADIFWTVSPRHQDRGSGNVASHNDNEGGASDNITVVAATYATYRLSLFEEVFKCWKTKSWILTTI